jgi:hypothetical protein
MPIYNPSGGSWGFALAIPGDGAKEIYGQNENYTLFEVFGVFSF